MGQKVESKENHEAEETKVTTIPACHNCKQQAIVDHQRDCYGIGYEMA